MFRFENFWPLIPGFMPIVQDAWAQQQHHTNPMHRLAACLRSTAKELRKWSKSIISDVALQLALANEVILQLDIAQENRPLSVDEQDLRRKLKIRVLGLAAVDKARKRQASRITWLKVGDAS